MQAKILCIAVAYTKIAAGQPDGAASFAPAHPNSIT